MAIAIRPAERSDVAGIRTVARRAWHEAHTPIVGRETVEEFLGEYYDRDSFVERVERDDTVLRVAVGVDDADEGRIDDRDHENERGVVVGYTLVTFEEPVAHLAHVYVDPARWGEGVGGRLLSAAERAARERGCERIDLGVMTENDRAVGFYEAAGYERTDEDYDDRIDTSYYSYEKPL